MPTQLQYDIEQVSNINNEIDFWLRELESWMTKAEPQRRNLTWGSVFFTALTTAVAGYSALGAHKERAISFLAFFASLGSLIFAGLLKADDVDNRISKVRMCANRLEKLRFQLSSCLIEMEHARTELENSTTDVSSFISAAHRRQSAIALTKDSVHGRITTPKSGVTVSKWFSVSGSTGEFGPGVHLWLATQVGLRIWPKENALSTPPFQWQQQVHETGASGTFDLCLLAVDEEGHQAIKSWIDNGNRHQEFPEMLFDTYRMRKVFVVTDLKNAASASSAADTATKA